MPDRPLLLERVTDLEPPFRALVVTVVHDPRDARIWFRQIRALLQAGWQVTYAAPFTEKAQVSTAGLSPAERDRLRLVDLPRAYQRVRIRADLRARAVMRRHAPGHDVVLVHDPELLLATAGMDVPGLVWDVHEDPAGAFATKDWIPRQLRGMVSREWRRMESVVEDRHPLILAEWAYRDRFEHPHPVVPNAVNVPDTREPNGTDRVVCLGSVTRARGGHMLAEIGQRLHDETEGATTLEVIGPCHDHGIRSDLERAQEAGHLVWRGFMPSNEALARLRGALAGLVLLHDSPNYRVSMPTKLMEYCAHGVPVITTPLALAAKQVRTHRTGVVVPYDDAETTVDAIVGLAEAPEVVDEMAANGYELARREYDWQRWAPTFVELMEEHARARRGQDVRALASAAAS
ncbi:glycosyltransferase [Desertihabitans brevis]|uniref:Glycosyltransferase n=1 Tax=Desertihabitans brevis TaxID=2268447 RepID=A0A367YTC3_9ACTN|nr:glycosyltransferase family 4 protein [Desertihabitans brevis]RCK69145.1 glycosyltransferase [Desertihabitans brevis]